jgi:sulfur carrier protein ThiS
MRITVKFMSQLKALAGVDEAAVELPEAATVAELLRSLREPFPDIFPLVQHAMVMVNHKIVAPQAVLHDGDQVMLLQLLGGG